MSCARGVASCDSNSFLVGKQKHTQRSGPRRHESAPAAPCARPHGARHHHTEHAHHTTLPLGTHTLHSLACLCVSHRSRRCRSVARFGRRRRRRLARRARQQRPPSTTHPRSAQPPLSVVVSSYRPVLVVVLRRVRSGRRVWMRRRWRGWRLRESPRQAVKLRTRSPPRLSPSTTPTPAATPHP